MDVITKAKNLAEKEVELTRSRNNPHGKRCNISSVETKTGCIVEDERTAVLFRCRVFPGAVHRIRVHLLKPRNHQCGGTNTAVVISPRMQTATIKQMRGSRHIVNWFDGGWEGGDLL